MSKINVVHFLNYCGRGGTIDMVEALIRHSSHNHTYVTFRASEERVEAFKGSGITLIELGNENIEGAIKYMKENADVVHCQFSGGPEPGLHIGIESGKPVVQTCQSPDLPPGTMYDNVYIIPVSNGIVTGWPKDVKYHRVIYSCAEPIQDVTDEECIEFCRKLGLDPFRPIIGRLGRLEGLKRPMDFIDIALNMNSKHQGLQFLLVGDGNDGNGIRHMANRAKEQGLEIALPGHLTGKEKAIAYHSMDIFLYPTTFEGFGIVFAEAMSIGLPVVTYSDNVTTDIVGGAGVYGMDNRFYDSLTDHWGHMAALTINLLMNRREYDKLSKNALNLYDRRYRPEIMSENYDSLYEEIV